jgi:ATP-binding protein involved in chromosome partitioning
MVSERMKEIARIIAVSSGKGGVGKSLLASTLALTLAATDREVGLVDLDFTSPSTHVILGARDHRPTEDRGLVPASVHALKYMSIVYYSGEHAIPLRGADVSNVLLELLSITRWGKLDFLIMDMPPGIGDTTLDLLRWIKKAEFLIVTTPSRLAFETVRKLASLLKVLNTQTIGVVENMKMLPDETVKQQTLELGLDFLGEIPYDPKVEEAVGDARMLLETSFAKKVAQISSEIVRRPRLN